MFCFYERFCFSKNTRFSCECISISKQTNKRLDKKQFDNQINKVDEFWFFDRKVDDSLFKELGAKGEDMCVFQYDYNKTNKVMSYMLIDDCSKHIKFGERRL